MRMTVQLCEGKRVLNPETGLYLKTGEPVKVTAGQFWFRRVIAGDVAEVEEKVSEAKKAVDFSATSSQKSKRRRKKSGE